MMALFEGAAYILILGVIAAASLTAFIVDKVFGWGFYPVVSAIIGSVIGIVILLIAPLQGVLAMVLAAVGAFLSSVIQEKVL
ncbi:MAG: hypothetical protein IJM62_00350 [Lachnospiraceae bacterium]|nr:hypothetical protein [Lachnospiraceae bacterium]